MYGETYGPCTGLYGRYRPRLPEAENREAAARVAPSGPHRGAQEPARPTTTLGQRPPGCQVVVLYEINHQTYISSAKVRLKETYTG